MARRLTQWLSAFGVALALLAAGPAWAQPAADQDVKATIEALKQHIEAQDKKIADLEAKTNDEAMTKARVEEIRKIVKEMNADAGGHAWPAWLDNLTFSGDMRLRYQGNYYDWGSKKDTEIKDRNRPRFRLRFGFEKAWPDEDMTVGFRLASGEDNGPNSENQTFDGVYAKKQIWIDQAWAKWSPHQVQGFTLIGGKMPTPWITNELFFDADINPEGFWAEYKVPNLGMFQPFVGAGYFMLHDMADDHRTVAELYQTGVRVEPVKDVKYTLAGFLHQYEDYDLSTANPRGNDNPLTNIPGFNDVGLSNNLQLPVCGRPLTFFFDWAHNCENHDPNPHYDDADNAFATGVKYGQNKKKGDWSIKYLYAYIEANSLPGTLCDDDFGYANRKGHVLGAEYNLLDTLSAGVKLYFTEPIFVPATTTVGKTNGAIEDLTTTLMLEMLWKF